MNAAQDEIEADDDGADEQSEYNSLIANAKIMLVDDEPINTEVLKSYLAGEGYSNFVDTSDSVHALDILVAEKPDVLLLDLMMPEVSGFDILSAMKQDKRLEQIPVIILTSSDDSSTKLKALKMGAMDFLSKPVDASELALRLRNTLAAKAYQHHLVNFDSLTNLPRVDYFVEHVKNELQQCRKEDLHAAVMTIRMDNLSQINDSFGRTLANDFIKHFASVLINCVKPAALVSANSVVKPQFFISRIAGDKFAVMLSSLENVQVASQLARRIVIETGKPVKIDSHTMFTTTRIGIATFPEDSDNHDILLTRAETALQHARRLGGAGHTFFADEMNKEASRLLGIETGLRSAIEKKELLVTFQPKVDVSTGKIIGAEALLRWISKELGFVGPDEFIPIAERTGQIVPIGEWVLEQACKAAAGWCAQFNMPFRLAVNVSIRQLFDADMTMTVRRVIEKTSFPVEYLTLELTENMVMENAESNVAKLLSLKKIGLKISIDDFGTGYSSLSYLQQFPLDELKIDRSFINEIENESSKAPIVRAMVSLAHDLNMTVVAEGIETDVQLDYVRQLGCELYQGYYCSKPLVHKAFTELLLQNG